MTTFIFGAEKQRVTFNNIGSQWKLVYLVHKNKKQLLVKLGANWQPKFGAQWQLLYLV